jgi:hypothetical protein
MCYLPPGPRCSHHAHQELLRALRAVEKEENVSRKLVLQERVESAQKAYNATPRGQHALSNDIAHLNREVANYPERLSELNDLKLAYSEGRIARKDQLLAYLVSQEKRNSTVKEVLQTGNKQKQAVGIAFSTIITHLGKNFDSMDAHIVDDSIIAIEGAKADSVVNVLVLHQKYQDDFALLKQTDSTRSLTGNCVEDNAEVISILTKYDSYTSIPPETEDILFSWVVEVLSKRNVHLVANVDVRTEEVRFFSVEKLNEYYDFGFKMKPKYGGTSAYRHGATSELETALGTSIFAEAKIHTAKVSGITHTYLVDAPLSSAKEQQVQNFYLAPKRTETGELYYEVRIRHVPSQMRIMLTLSRKNYVVTDTDINQLDMTLSSLFMGLKGKGVNYV